MSVGSEDAARVAGVPTLAVVSVREFRVVDLPEDGLPTRPISGSRGMLSRWVMGADQVRKAVSIGGEWDI